jgi:OFA family oxalate/formate antiporter-like MFS transporter
VFMSEKIFYGWWIVIACFLISLYVGSAIFFGFTAFVEPLQREFGWSYTKISLAASLRGVEVGIFAPLVGLMVDRFGARKLVLLGAITIGAGFFLLSRVQSLLMFYCAFFFIAMGGSGCSGVVLLSAVANWFKKSVGKAMGFMVSGFGASGLLIPFIVKLIDAHGWRTTYLILGMGIWAVGIPLSFVVRDRPEKYGLLPDGEAEVDPSTGNVETSIPELTFAQAWRSRSFLFLASIEFIRMCTLSAVVIHVMPYLDDIGIARSTAALVAGGIPLFSVIGRFGLGYLGDVLEKKIILCSSILLTSFGMLAFSHARALWLLPAFLLLYSPGFGGIIVMRGAILRDYFGTVFFGRLIGILFGAGAVGGIVGPAVAGWAFDVSGSYVSVWLGLCAFSILGFALANGIRPLKGST